MTEQEWLSSVDPAAMLRHLDHRLTKQAPGGSPMWDYWRNGGVKDRQLRLFACACARQVWHRLTDERSRRAVELAEERADDPSMPQAVWGPVIGEAFRACEGGTDVSSPAGLAHDCLCGDPVSSTELGIVDPEVRADLLREIIGNPWRPIELPTCSRCGGDYKMRWIDDPDTGICSGCVRGIACLTPQILSLARAAYEERPESKCPDCKGEGGGYVCPSEGGLWYGCQRCGGDGFNKSGTGRIGSGHLDPFRLALVADALEEAGCPAEVEEDCPVCSEYLNDPENPWKGKPGYRPERDPASGRHEGGWTNCKTCNSAGQGTGKVSQANPLLAHLRSPRPHVKGCWVLDLVLNKELEGALAQ